MNLLIYIYIIEDSWAAPSALNPPNTLWRPVQQVLGWVPWYLGHKGLSAKMWVGTEGNKNSSGRAGMWVWSGSGGWEHSEHNKTQPGGREPQ